MQPGLQPLRGILIFLRFWGRMSIDAFISKFAGILQVEPTDWVEEVAGFPISAEAEIPSITTHHFPSILLIFQLFRSCFSFRISNARKGEGQIPFGVLEVIFQLLDSQFHFYKGLFGLFKLFIYISKVQLILHNCSSIREAFLKIFLPLFFAKFFTLLLEYLCGSYLCIWGGWCFCYLDC